jgi:hypothetical protein
VNAACGPFEVGTHEQQYVSAAADVNVPKGIGPSWLARQTGWQTPIALTNRGGVATAPWKTTAYRGPRREVLAGRISPFDRRLARDLVLSRLWELTSPE